VGATSPRWPRKIFSEVDQIALARTLLSIARHNRACLTLHGDAALAKACGADGVHLPAGSDPIVNAVRLKRYMQVSSWLCSPSNGSGRGQKPLAKSRHSARIVTVDQVGIPAFFEPLVAVRAEATGTPCIPSALPRIASEQLACDRVGTFERDNAANVRVIAAIPAPAHAPTEP
jgi:hypothetical protein